MNDSPSAAVLDSKAIAAHILRALARAQSRGRAIRLDELAIEVGARRADVRAIVSRLHAEDHLDAARLKLTLSGLALAAAMREGQLRPVRRARAAVSNVA